MAPPDSEVLNAELRPTLEGLALGIARRDYGAKGAALMGMSAARKHGVVPRALGVGIVAVPNQRPRLRTTFGESCSSQDRSTVSTSFAPEQTSRKVG